MNSDVLKTLSREYEHKKMIAEKNTEYLKNETYEQNPRLAEIDSMIKKIGIEATKAALTANPSEKEAIITELTDMIETLKKEKQQILENCGVSLTPNYECAKCQDTGYITVDYTTQMCSCMKQKLINESYNKSNLFRLKNDTFSNFNDNLYDNKPNIERYGINNLSNELTNILKEGGFVE